MRLISLKIEPWTTDSTRTYKDAVFQDTVTGVKVSIPLTEGDLIDIEKILLDKFNKAVKEIQNA